LDFPSAEGDEGADEMDGLVGVVGVNGTLRATLNAVRYSTRMEVSKTCTYCDLNYPTRVKLKLEAGDARVQRRLYLHRGQSWEVEAA
jgi:hypothetical protein